jgi:hypothetical protein
MWGDLTAHYIAVCISILHHLNFIVCNSLSSVQVLHTCSQVQELSQGFEEFQSPGGRVASSFRIVARPHGRCGCRYSGPIIATSETFQCSPCVCGGCICTAISVALAIHLQKFLLPRLQSRRDQVGDQLLLNTTDFIFALQTRLHENTFRLRWFSGWWWV